jgi:hypothetical protein
MPTKKIQPAPDAPVSVEFTVPAPTLISEAGGQVEPGEHRDLRPEVAQRLIDAGLARPATTSNAPGAAEEHPETTPSTTEPAGGV